MSGSDDDRSEGRPDEAKPADEAPPSKPAGGSVFDSPWGVGSKAVFTPPSIASFAPRTSEGSGAMSGEFGELAAKQDDAPVEPAKPGELGAVKSDAEPSEAATPDELPVEAAKPGELTRDGAKPDEQSVDAAKPDEPPADAAKSDEQPLDAANSDEPSADAAKSDAPPADAAKSDEPPVDAAKSDAPPADAAKSDEPSADAAKSDAPSAEDESDEPSAEDESDDAPADAAPSEDEPDDPPTDPRHADIDPPRRRPSQPTQPSRPTSPWLIIAVVVGILLAVWYVSNARDSHEAGEGPSKPNHAANELPGDTREPQPQPRSKVVTHTKDDPTPPTTDEPATEPTSDGGEVEPPPPEPVVEPAEPIEPPPEQPVVEPPPEQPQPRPSVDNPRDPSLIPAGTPAENAKAFSKLPVAPSDGPPIGGIGRSGIHVDEIAMGEGRDNVSCEQPTRAFTTSGTEFVNVCFRVIHPRASETLRVYWEKDGTVTRRGKVRIPENLHAYKTRAYLQVRPEYVGKWRVRIVPEGEDGTELAVAEFEITN